ncbi:class I SAM-dependent methyltransferase [Anaerovibrio lipolyticus]|uniref:class I SAM-dependent methyltransferase n=1 Tax=Anaerovibrio lipolyticus TaxID=82374 RepID=UPI0026F2092E|nr:class I SAM-dependent methyltransferase [Anaerovibrio lipolyticus]MBE6105128.1 class I SAM-dependent methyltransferase [Anaerovibrio lipolyticus]
MRLKGGHEEIDYEATKAFFNNRSGKYNADNPYAVTMYQDNNPELVKQRNAKEVEKLLPLLSLDEKSKVLDIACGIGRWSDAIALEIDKYCGIDFCEDFILKARELNEAKQNRFFFVGKSNEISECLKNNKWEDNFNRVLLVGALMYLNDQDVDRTFEQIGHCVDDNAIVVIREPIGIEERLTLKEHFSDELDDNYNAIYRTRDEIVTSLNNSLLKQGFRVKEEAFLFEDSLNNRKETAQYYFILER